MITPYFDAGVDLSEHELKMMSARERNLIIQLPSDTTIMEEMEDILKIQTYLLRKGGVASTEVIEEIKIRKSREVGERKDRVKNLLIEGLKEADCYVNMQKIELKSKNPVEKINSGLMVLIDNIYNKLSYITEFLESTKDLHDLFFREDNQIKIFNENEDVPNKLALGELMDFIDRNTQRHIPLTLKTILDLYAKPPYGWLPDDIRGLIIRLFKAQEIKIQLGNDYLSSGDKNLIQYLTKKDYADRLLIKKRAKTPEKYLKNARELIKEVFNYAAVPSDEDGLMNRFKELTGFELSVVRELLVRYEKSNYPGKDVLDRGKAVFAEILEIKDGLVFFEKLYQVKDQLLDYEEAVFDVKKFFENQREQFDRAIEQLKIYEKNKTYILDSETIQMVLTIEKIVKSPKPYSEIAKLPHFINNFNERFVRLLQEECRPVRAVIENDRQKVRDEVSLYDFKDELSGKFNEKFQDLLNRLDHSHNFYEAIAMKEESDRLKMRCFEEIRKLKELKELKDREKAKKDEKPDIIGGGNDQPIYKMRKTVNVSIAHIFHGAKTIEKEEDIEELLDYLRHKLKKELNENTILKLI